MEGGAGILTRSARSARQVRVRRAKRADRADRAPAGVWGRSPQRGPGAQPPAGVRGAAPPGKFLVFKCILVQFQLRKKIFTGILRTNKFIYFKLLHITFFKVVYLRRYNVTHIIYIFL